MTASGVANRIRKRIPASEGIAFCADPAKYGDASVILVTPGDSAPQVYRIVVEDVTGDETWLAEAVLRARV